MIDRFFYASCAIAEAQKCARMLLEQTGQRSTWCVVTRKSFWPASYFFAGDEELLQAKLRQGHEIVLAFAVTQRRALTSSSQYQPVYPSNADKLLRHCARQAMRHVGISRCLV